MEKTSARREQLVETALRLFYRDGFHATGIDAILAEAGVAKMTLYNHFGGKDGLILAVLQLRDERWMAAFREGLARRGGSAEERMLAAFDFLGEWFAQPDFRGCLFINAASEFCGRDDRVAEHVARHKRLVRDEFRSLAAEAGARDPDALADGLALLAEGAIVLALIRATPEPAAAARESARVLIRATLPSGRKAAAT